MSVDYQILDENCERGPVSPFPGSGIALHAMM